MDPSVAAHDAFRAGHFRETFERLSTLGTQNLSDTEKVLLAETLQKLGRREIAAAHCEAVRGKVGLSFALSCRCADLLATFHYEEGNLTESLAQARKAQEFAERAGDPALIATATARLLERLCDSSAFDASHALASVSRRNAARTADPQAKVSVHLSFARLEGRNGRLENALRHLQIGREILSFDPNLSLRATLDLDESSVRTLLGDLDGAWKCAIEASVAVNESGWIKGQGFVTANLAYLALLLGRFDEVERYLADARKLLAANPSYILALAETEAQWAFCTGEYKRAESMLETIPTEGGEQLKWYELCARDLRIKLLLRQGEWQLAAHIAEASVPLALSVGAEPIAESLRLSQMEALAELGQPILADALWWQKFENRTSIELIAAFQISTGKALISSGGVQRGSRRVVRGTRLYELTQYAPLQKHALLLRTQIAAAERQDTVNIVAHIGTPPDLDTAVALIELGAHPHILAREACAVINDAGCAEAVAAVATAKDATRVVETHGWTDHEALRAAGGKDGAILMPAGTQRDETWQVVARPKAGIDDHCTLAALGRVLAASVALEKYRRDEKQRAALWPAEALDGDPESIWASEQTSELLGIARRIAATPISVLLTGETGTGKEMLARVIHRASDRADRPFLPFNCAAVPRDMIESQLFGYRKGAFTGADTAFPGVIRAAAGGTLFLDEIAEIGVDLQPKLLRFLETHEIHPIGEPQPVAVDVRVIAATNAKLEDLVAAGRFREDLFYRLNVIRLKLPPLRERREEIPALLQHYLRRHGDEQKKGTLQLSDETLEYLLLYSWPGNVRQLANEVRRMVALAEPDGTLTPALLSPEVQASRRTIAAADHTESEVRVRLDQPLPVAVEMLEQIMVRRALDRSRGRVEEASRLLGISRKGLFLKRRRWGLPRAS